MSSVGNWTGGEDADSRQDRGRMQGWGVLLVDLDVLSCWGS